MVLSQAQEQACADAMGISLEDFRIAAQPPPVVPPPAAAAQQPANAPPALTKEDVGIGGTEPKSV